MTDLPKRLRAQANHADYNRVADAVLQCEAADEIERLRHAVRDLSQAAIDAYDTLAPVGKAGLFDDVWDCHRDVIDACRESSGFDTGDTDA